MHLTPYQIIVPLLSILAMVYAWNLVMRQKKTIWEACLWTLFWGGIALVALFPGTLGYLSAATGIKSQENAVIFTGLGILFFLVFYIIIRIEEMEQRQTRMIRALALREAGLEKDDKAKKE
ncbi:MAG TPA: DUF2304 domain-containing protein [Candidatus Peribacteraceae bacterium]|nr:DUF2304 domain-containing protein [Candidatus Peribacteraceae bacterium]